MSDMQIMRGNSDHSANLDRILMERGEHFDVNSNNNAKIDKGITRLLNEITLVKDISLIAILPTKTLEK